MKRLLLLLCAIPWIAQATNQITVSTTSGRPGDTVQVTVSLSCTDAIAAGEFHLPLGQYMTYIPNSATLNTVRSDGHTLMAAAQNETLVVNIFSMSLNAIKGTSGTLFTYQVRLGNEPATYAIVPTCVLSNDTGQALSSNVSQGSVTILAPKIQIVNQSVDYGHIPIRSTYNQSITVRNIGTEPLTISNVIVPSDEFMVSTASFTILVGGSQSVTLTYHPLLRGAFSGKLTFRSNAINDPDVYKASYASIVADPFSVNELHIQSESGISDDTVTISVRVNNMEPLVGAQFSIQLPEQLEYIPNSAATSARSSMHSVMGSLDGQKLTILLYSMANDTITGNDGELLTFRLRLNGTSGSYYLTPTDVILSNTSLENMTSAVSGAYVAIRSPRISGNTSVNLGNISITEPTLTKYSIYNAGQTSLTINRVAFLQEGFSVVEQLPLVIPAYSSSSFTIKTQLSSEGDFSTLMQVYSNDPQERMKSVTISGHAYEPNKFSLTGMADSIGNYTLSVALNNYSDITALQLDIHWLDAMVTSQSALATSSRLSNHSTAIYSLGNGDYRVVIFSMDNQSIVGHEGELFRLTYTPSSSVTYCGTDIRLDSVVVSDPFGISKNTPTSTSLTISHTDSTSFAIAEYGSYTWNEQTYTKSGDYVQNFMNRFGCDSVVTLHLTILESPGTDLMTAEYLDIVVHPNPATEMIYIQGEGIQSVDVYSAAGQLIKQLPAVNVLDVQHWERGVYLLHIKQNDQYVYRNVIKK